MENETSKSTNQLVSIMLILMSIIPIYSLIDRYLLVDKIDFDRSFPILVELWFFLPILFSLVLITLIANRKFGALLIVAGISSTRIFTIILDQIQEPYSFSTSFWIFNSIHLASLILAIIILKRENQSYFNLEFKSKTLGFEKTNRLIIAFISTYLLYKIVKLIFTFTLIPFERHYAISSSIVLLIISILFLITGIYNKTRLTNLAFVIVLPSVIQHFYSGLSMNIAALSKDGDFDLATPFGVYTIIEDCLLLIYGALLFFIVRTYINEKRLNNTENKTSLEF